MSPFTDRAITEAMRLIAKGLGAGRLQTNASGLEHIPPQGPALLVARHYHHFFDGIALFASLPRPFHILVTLDWAQSSLVRNVMTPMTRLARWPVILRADALSQLQGRSVFSTVDVVRYQRKGLKESVNLLVAGRILVIFPEGYPNIDPHYTPKTRDEEILPFKAGFAAIAAAAEKRCGAKTPLIPVGFRYTAGRKWTAHVSFGAALDGDDFDSREALVKKFERDVARLSDITLPSERARAGSHD
jgi:1-acyl-sn-glycerol-3-phosphate acyltransferase